MKLTDKIDLTLTDKDKEYIKDSYNVDLGRYLTMLRDKKFKVGDVLIKKHRSIIDGKTTWQTPRVYPRGSNRKYVVVHVDEYGIPYIKAVSVRGHLLGTIKSLGDVDFRWETYEEDPDVVDAILLNKEEFDPIENEREKNKEMERK